jgi:hypothetical protein
MNDTTPGARADLGGDAALLASSLDTNGWIQTGARVRTIHTVCYTDASGLTVALSCENGTTRLDFESEYRAVDGGRRYAWYGEATRELPAEVLAAVASANAIAFDAGQGDEPQVRDLLSAAGWQQPDPEEQAWLSPDGTREVEFIDDECVSTDLPWRVRHTVGRPVAVSACEDTPAQVIAAFALTDSH